MDSNGRQRAASGSSSNLTLPTSSTFRRLPTLARSPFRRNDKFSSFTQPSDPSIDSADELGAQESAAPLSALDERHQQHSSSSQFLPPSRTSSLPQTPAIPDANESVSLDHLSSLPQLGLTSNMTADSPFPNNSDLEPITYPAHLAQSRPPTTRPRDGTLGSGSSVVLGLPASLPTVNVTRRKDSAAGSSHESHLPASNHGSQEYATLRTDGDGGLHKSRAAREKEGETDSGVDDTAVRRRRAGTRNEGDRNAIAASSNHRDRDGPSDRDKSRKTSSKTLREPRSTRPLEPSLPTSSVKRASTSAMYFSLVPSHGRPPSQALRAHSGTLVGDRIWLIGGVDKQSCWRGVSWFDTESLQWSTIETQGERFPPLRAHSTTLVGDKLYIFGGGDGPSYSNEVWTLDTNTHRFTKPTIGNPRSSLPPPRRAHTTVHYRNYLVVFGGGNGQAALNDVWALDVSDPEHLAWHEWKTKGDAPQKKGYHSANLVGDKMIVFGGSDGHASFADVHILNLKTLVWTLVVTEIKHNRLSHTSTQVGSYLFIIGGHNGQTYAQDVLLFNLVTLQWETKIPQGAPPPGRGYHVALLHDARIYISGGYNGESVFDDLWTLDLSAGAYLPQVTTFEVDETIEHSHRQGGTAGGP